MVNSGEVLLKAVMFVEPKLLTGSDQNGKWPGAGSQRYPSTDAVPPAERHDLNSAAVVVMNEVSPQSSPSYATEADSVFGRNAYGAAGVG